MLGLDLRRVEKGDELYNIIANKDLIALNQDALGIQAKRIFTTADKDYREQPVTSPDQAYITNCDRVDVLAKPLADGSLALSFFNLSQEKKCGNFTVDIALIKKYLGSKLPQAFYEAAENSAKNFRYNFRNLWNGETGSFENGIFRVSEIEGCGNITLKIWPAQE